MMRAISVIIGITVALMAVAVPGALGEGRIGGLQPQTTPSTYLDAGERAVLVQPGVQVDRRTDAWDRDAVISTPSTYPDAAERAVPPTTGNADYVDASERGSGPATTTVVEATDSGFAVDWPQVGLALGLGLALGIGLVFVLRTTRHGPGPLAH